MTLFFMHIPKTAGTTFRHFLEREVRGAGGEPIPMGLYSDYDGFVERAGDLGREYDLISGHYPYYVRKLLPPDTQVVTVIRDPVERCLSHIKHQILHERDHGPGCGVSEVNAFIELPVNRFFLATLADLTVKFLSYEGHPNTPVESTPESLERALANCDDCRWGFTDSLAAFQQRISRELFGKDDLPENVPTENAAEDRTPLGGLHPRNIDRLRELNSLDLRLYDTLRARED